MFKTNFLALACTTLAALSLAASPANAATGAHTHAHSTTATSTSSTAASSTAAKPKTKLKITPEETVIYVGDMHCAHCAKTMASKLYTVKGVVKVRTDVKADVAIVTPQSKKKIDPMALWSAANASGFPALKLEGPTGTYVLDTKTKSAKLLPKKAVTPKG